MNRFTPLLALPLLAACANARGPLQPQAVSGPCRVDSFFLQRFSTTPTTMTIANTGEACTFTLVNAALNQVITANFLTGAPSHGRATPALTEGARQAVVTYQPAPGYVGPDKFDITLQPDAVGVTVTVQVTPPT